MEINLKDKLRELRSRKKVTQEAVAEHLGITSQSVGKWERGEGFPDITLLPALALYFGVSVDDLLGVGKARQEERIRGILDETDRLTKKNDHDRCLEILYSAHREFPDDCRIMARIVEHVHWSERDSKDPESEDLAIRLGERVLAESDNEDLRRNTIILLSRIYNVRGDKENAVRYAKMLGNYYQTSDENLMKILRGEEGTLKQQENIRELTYMLFSAILHSPEHRSPEELIRRAETGIALLRLIYEDGDFGFEWGGLFDAYDTIARAAAETKDVSRCLDALEEAARIALLTEKLWKHDMPHTSHLVDRLTDRPGETNEYELKPLLKDRLEHNACFDFLREDERFRAICEKLA